MRTLSIGIFSLAFVFSCEKGETNVPDDTAGGPVEVAGSGDTGAEAPEPEAPQTWQDMDFDARKMHMGLKVYPDMKEKFQAFDGERFADFKCQTCHGDDMVEVKFEMPNSLTPLNPADPWGSAVDMDEKTAKFMAEMVVPPMGEHLNMEVKPDGSGEMNCFSCHLKDE